MYNKQLGRGYFIINLDTLNEFLLSQQVSGTKMRNEKRQGLYKHSPYSVAHVDLEIHLVCLFSPLLSYSPKFWCQS